MIKKIFTALTLVILTACGGGGGGSEPAPVPQPTPAPTPEPVTNVTYSDDFETYSSTNENLAPWDAYINQFNGEGTRTGGYAVSPAPIAGDISALVDEDNNYVNIYSNYQDGTHNGGSIEANFFRELGEAEGYITQDMVGTYRMSFSAKHPDSDSNRCGGTNETNDATGGVCKAFIKVLNSGDFSSLLFETTDTTELTTEWQTLTLDFEITEGMVGHIYQSGFMNTAGNYAPTGVHYDNVTVESYTPEPTPAPAASVWINEFHYDNASTDEGEFVEVAGAAGTDLSEYKIVFYNGNGGSSYGEETLSGTLADQSGGYGTATVDKSGIQNGAPDGIALVAPDGSCLQFISYEGQMTASGGACDGQTSEELSVSEGSSTPAGESLQLSGSGTSYSDFTWEGPITNTKGAVNTNQTFGAGTSSYTVTNEGNDYLIDDVKHASVTVKRGSTVVFDTSYFGGGHPFRLSVTEDGRWNNGQEYTDGVTREGNDSLTWVVPADFSGDTMYYYCTLHSGMAGAGKINIID